MAGEILQLYCNTPVKAENTFLNKVKSLFSSEEKIVEHFITKGIRRGSGKLWAKNNNPPFKIYFSPKLKRFISAPIKLDGYIELSHFIDGTLTLPECMGAPVQIHHRKGHFD